MFQGNTAMPQNDFLAFFKRHKLYFVLGITFAVLGVIYANINFPEIPVYKQIIGGTMFGVFCMFCGIGYHLFQFDD